MTSKSNTNGRAYEYAVITELLNIGKNSKIINNSSLEVSKSAFDSLNTTQQARFLSSARSSIQKLVDLEPNLIDGENSILSFNIQPDERGKQGDVRDIVIKRESIQWEIGLSVKNNNSAVKHSRLSKKIDFGKEWFGIKCSREYWEEIKPIFDDLDLKKSQDEKWRNIKDKDIAVYRPLLQAFINEINTSYTLHGKIITKRMVEYLLGKFDFYKIINKDLKYKTIIQVFNLRGNLGKGSANIASSIVIPIAALPTRIVNLIFKPDSNNTVELYLDNGWQFSFRIHNASTNVEPSLKFDIQLKGMPSDIMMFICSW